MKILCTTAMALFLVTASLFSQNIVGTATYKTDRKVDLKMDSTVVDVAMHDMIAAQLKKSSQKEYSLDFNTNESVYKIVEKLDAPSPSSGGFNISFSESSSVLYRNTKELKYINENEISDKPFLIKDVAEKPNWVLGKEVKNIGNYTCFKATWTRDVDGQTFDSITKEMVDKTESKTTTAWYTLDIPVQHGPSSFWGLPGLILEVEDGELTILCSKIVINPEKPVVIKMPKKGKVVTQAEFDAIEKKKAAEMMERFKSLSDKRGNGTTQFIKLGGE